VIMVTSAFCHVIMVTSAFCHVIMVTSAFCHVITCSLTEKQGDAEYPSLIVWRVRMTS
jgi:hypothetical protein